MSKDGIFIVVDGVDGGGKTTQVAKFCDALKVAGEDVVCSKEPTNGTWGMKIRESATTGRHSPEDELELFIRDRHEHVDKLIQPSLDQGKVVIVDRYYYSTAAYQGIRGMDTNDILARMRREFPMPDVAIFLDLPITHAIHRISDVRGDTPNEFEGESDLTEIREVFHAIANECDEAFIVDGTPSIDAVSRKIAEVLLKGALKKRCRKPYACDELYCAFRKAGDCGWSNIKHSLKMQLA